jgi:hypothetical protein
MNNEQDFNANFNTNEQGIIARFVEYVAQNNQNNQPMLPFSDTNQIQPETDNDIKQNVLDWLDKKYRTKLGRRPK